MGEKSQVFDLSSSNFCNFKIIIFLLVLECLSDFVRDVLGVFLHDWKLFVVVGYIFGGKIGFWEEMSLISWKSYFLNHLDSKPYY